MKRLALHLVVLLLSMTAVPQTVQKSAPTDQDLTSQQKDMVVRLSNFAKNFGKKEFNSPGVELTLKEISRSRTTDRTLVKYELYATGFPKDAVYTIYEVKISGTFSKFLTGVTLDPSGRAICAGRKGTCSGSGLNSPIDLVFFAGKAEPKRLALVSDDDAHLKGFLAVIPFPNSTTDKACRLESVIGTPKGELTYLQGTGFEPNEELVVDGESYGEKNHGVAKAEADGSYFAAILPGILGKTSGSTIYKVKGKNCAPELTFSWGTYQLE